jgi:hypothetical protein
VPFLDFWTMSSSYQHYQQQQQQPPPPQKLHSPKQSQQSNQLPITPQQVVEKMSFSPLGQPHGVGNGGGSGGADAAAGNAKAWQPVAPPPAAPPPPPPCRRSVDTSPMASSSYPYHDNNKCDDHQRHPDEEEKVELDDRFSNIPAIYGTYGYHQATSTATTSTYTKGNSSGGHNSASRAGQSSRSAPFPSITNFGYQEEDGSGVGDFGLGGSRTYSSSHPGGSSSTLRGDASLRPNTGQTNDAWGGIGSLTEIASQLRWYTVGTCVTAVLWEGFAFPSRLLIETWVYPAKTVLGGYLAVFCILFLGVDLGWKLQDTIGILYHPLGRGFLLLFMASMCFGILASWWESLLGIAFLGCGGMYIYAYCSYPEYRRWQSYEENTMWQDVKDAMKQRSHGWADPDAVVSVASMAWNRAAAASGGGSASEQQSLLNPV